MKLKVKNPLDSIVGTLLTGLALVGVIILVIRLVLVTTD